MSLQEQLIHDLKWAVNSPSLLANPGNESAGMGKLRDEHIDGDALENFFTKKKSRRVGHYFEDLVHFWLRNIRKVEIVEKGFQIQDGGKTLGEIDFLFRDENGELNHWEIAVKFYLYFSDENHTGSHFIGPNAKDTLERKTKRLFEHQLPLSEKYFPAVTRRIALVKGRIFYPPNQEPNSNFPLSLAHTHLKGKWIRSLELDCLESPPKGSNFQILKKPFWLTSPTKPSAEAILAFRELRKIVTEHFNTVKTPLFLSVSEPRDDKFVETDRYFIVGENWPEI